VTTRDRGFTLIELIVAAAVLIVALGVTLKVADSSAKAGGASVARTAAIDAAELTAGRLVLELKQSSTDLNVPGIRRYWILPDGVRFQRVVGIGTSGTTFGQQVWSPEIEFTYDAAARTINRTQAGGTPQEIARGITGFSVRATSDGELVVTVSAARRATDGAQVTVRREHRVMPRNRAA